MDRKDIHDIVNLLTIASGMAKKSLESMEKLQLDELDDAKTKLLKSINALTRLENLVQEIRSKNSVQTQVHENQSSEYELKIESTSVSKDSEKMTVLIVDDESDILDLLSEELSSHNLNIIQAKDGRDGFSQFIQHKPKLVISDINMPHLNGIEMSQLIYNKNQNVKFILLGGDIDEKTIMNLPNAHSIQLMNKPFDFELLHSYIQNYLKVG